MLFATIGCSFTRGERLFYHRYVEDDILLKELSGPGNPLRATIPIFGQVPDEAGKHIDIATKQDERYMLDISYTGLLSKRLNCEYLTRSGDNFGNINNEISKMVEMSRTVPERKLDFIVLQLTAAQRDVENLQEFWDKLNSFSTSPEEKKKLLYHLEVEIPEQTVSKVLEANKLCKDNDIDLFVWSWEIELAKILKDEDFFVPIIYEGKSYICYEDMRGEHNVGLDQVFDIEDTHPNKFFNRVLYDSIIRKLKEKGTI